MSRELLRVSNSEIHTEQEYMALISKVKIATYLEQEGGVDGRKKL